ncbi:MAG TPA: glycosyltransferase [Solirubrobacterales bacterium]
MRLLVYTDYSYRRDGETIYAERAFVIFLGELARRVDKLCLLGRLSPEAGRFERSHYGVADEIEFTPLPHYESLSDPRAAFGAAFASTRAFARALDGVDAVWLLGPHPFCLLFAAIAAAKRRRVFLGVRQDFPQYVRMRHPKRRLFHLVGDALELGFRSMARLFPTIVVGGQLARNYRNARELLQISVSLIRESDLPQPTDLPERDYEGQLTAISVGRLEEEKNPLLLADVADRLGEGDEDWKLIVCGEGPLRDPLERRAARLGVESRIELRGYVPFDGGLLDLYRQSNALLHVSWTEGVPQILFEAFATGLPVVATDVGGVANAAGDAALLIPPGDADAAADALRQIANDADLRSRLTGAGMRQVRAHTLEAECERVAAFMRERASRRAR